MTTAKKYSVIVFDLGNVLLPFDYEIMIKKFNKRKPGLGDTFKKLYAENYDIHKKFERGEMFVEEFLTIMMGWLEDKVFGKEFCKIYSDVFTVNQKLVDLLPVLKKKYKLVLLSNTNYIHEKYGYNHYDFLKQFDKVFLSHKVGAIKPEKAIYRAVEEFTKKPSKEHFFIDDIQEYVDGAKKCGWDAVKYTDNDQLMKVLLKKEIIK
jgi:glucose-1-phosphatase